MTSPSGRRRREPPLPVKDGLSPSRVRLPDTAGGPISALEFLTEVVLSQRHRHPEDDEAAVLARFRRGEVVSPTGRAYAPEDLVSVGADVWFYRTPAPETPIPFDCRILHHDENLLVVHKPAFMSTMPRGRHITETATVRLRRSTGNMDLVPAHRLDRLTSGILMFTTRPEVRGAYQRLFAERAVDKRYEAIAPLRPEITPQTLWRSHIHKTPGEIQAVELADAAINAITEVAAVTPLQAFEQYHLERDYGPQPPLARYTLHPHTGRTHQLRLHMCHAGAPILGDPFYPHVHPDTAENYSTPLQLCSTHLGFTDPFTGQRRCFDTNMKIEASTRYNTIV
ncbi:tRNA pseudouridine synthase C [Corynebacterium ciconiae DSM 44920]|uniref:pseudouridine synthase n=1 Tax=Corynebacterium ciconiae TaxID=227319 RepID=UPI00035FAA00|nr:pseudouridine synthase [Corynebacterium ciconiae]WKD62231.1 tRNA pseudouridine synthase C [Corynebacterium ciconiae DSM 44920]